MDYFSPPFYMYEGVAVLRDYDDKEQFYYYPNSPHLAVDEQGRPAIRFIVFKQNLDDIAPGDEQAVGFLYFDTSLDWPAKTLDKVASKIQNDLQLDRPPRLAPLPYKSGTVRLVFLDRETQPPADPGQPGQPGGQPGTGGTPAGSPPHTGTGTPPPPEDQKFVTYLEASGIPSLYGDERAIFNAMLTKKATQMLYSAFDGFIPAGVIYQLNFQGMQRAFNIHAGVDWEQVYKYLEENFQVDVIFYSSDTDTIVSKLEEKKIITLTASLEGVGAEGMEGEFNAVRKTLQDYILDTFFKPAPNPNKPPDHSTVDGIVDAARKLRDLGVWGSVGYTRINYKAEEIRTLDIDYTVARAVERTIAPQGHLSLFFSDFNLTKDQVVTMVDGEDALWKDVVFDVMVDADFAHDGIDSVSLDVYYGPPQADTSSLAPTWGNVFDKQTNNRAKKTAWYNPDVGVKFQYRYTVTFSASALVPGQSLQLSSGWQTHEGNVLVITPSQKLYKIETVVAQIIDNFPFDRYPQVQVFMRYQDPATNWSHESSQLLSSNAKKMIFTFRTGYDSPSSVDYRATFLRADGRTYDVAWQSSSSDLIAITDPVPAKLAVLVVPSGDRSKIENLIVDLKYDDDKNKVHETGSVSFTQETINTAASPWVVQLLDPEQHRYSYSATLVTTDGNVITTGWIQDDRPTLTVGEFDLKRWRVQPQLVGPQLSDQKIDNIMLDLHYEDAANSFTAHKEIVFVQPGIGDTWQLILKDPSVRTYNYTLTYNMSTGFTQKVGPIASTDTFLTISSVPPTS